MKHLQTLSILIWAYRRKSSDTKATLYARVTINGVRAEISLSRRINTQLWDETNSMMKGDSDEAREVNESLEILRGELRQCYYELRSEKKEITAEAVKVRYLGVEEEYKTLMDVFTLHNNEMRGLIGKGMSNGTYKRYKVTQGKLLRFMKDTYNKSDIQLRDLRYKFVTDFEYYLKTTDNIAHNTAIQYVKKLKKIIGVAIKNEWLDKNPFLGFKCIIKETDRNVLTDEEIQLLINKTFPSKRLEQIRDVFIFSCYTGYAYAETKALTPGHIEKGIDGEMWVTINRSKTNGRSKVMLLPVAIELIEKYRNHPECVWRGALFPVKSNQKYNDYLKEVASLCGIQKELTTHIARHTFATTVTLANDVPIESVSAMLGHRSIRTTQIYAKVVQKKLSNNMRELRSKLTGNHPTEKLVQGE